MRRTIATLAVLGIALTSTACGDGDNKAEPTTTAPTTAPTSTKPPGKVVFEDTFDDDRNGWDPASVTKPYARMSIEGGAFKFNVTAKPPDTEPAIEFFPDGVKTSAAAGAFRSTRMEATVVTTSPGAPTLVCGASPDPAGELAGHMFSFTPYGHGSISKFKAGGALDVLINSNKAAIDAPPDPPAFAFTPGDPITMVAECRRQGSAMHLALSINGKTIVEADDASPSPPGIFEIATRWVGYAIKSEGFKPFTVEVRDLKVIDLG